MGELGENAWSISLTSTSKSLKSKTSLFLRYLGLRLGKTMKNEFLAQDL